MTAAEFFKQLRTDIELSKAIPDAHRPHPHSPPVQLKPVLLAHLDLVIQVSHLDLEKRRFSIESAKSSWRQVLEVISKHGLLDKYRDDNELKTDIQKFFNS